MASRRCDERPLDHQQQMIGIDRLGQKVERALLHRRDRVLDAAERRHHDDRQLRIELLGGAQDAEAVAFGQPQIGQHDAGPRRRAAPATASVWSRASMTVWPCASSAWRSIARSESLSSTRRMGGSAARRGTQLPQPAGRHAGAARFFLEVGDGLLGRRRSAVFSRSSSASAFWRSAPITARCAGSSRLTKSVVERVDARLQGVQRRSDRDRAACLQLLHAAGPVRLILDAALSLSLRSAGCRPVSLAVASVEAAGLAGAGRRRAGWQRAEVLVRVDLSAGVGGSCAALLPFSRRRRATVPATGARPDPIAAIIRRCRECADAWAVQERYRFENDSSSGDRLNGARPPTASRAPTAPG